MQSNRKVKQEYVGLRDYFRIVQRNFNLPLRNRTCVNCENKSKPQELSSGKPKSYARTRARGGCQCCVSGTVPQAWSNLTLVLLGISRSRPLISRWIQVAQALNPNDAGHSVNFSMLFNPAVKYGGSIQVVTEQPRGAAGTWHVASIAHCLSSGSRSARGFPRSLGSRLNSWAVRR